MHQTYLECKVFLFLAAASNVAIVKGIFNELDTSYTYNMDGRLVGQKDQDYDASFQLPFAKTKQIRQRSSITEHYCRLFRRESWQRVQELSALSLRQPAGKDVGGTSLAR